MEKKMEKTFQTSDLYLASALKINGFRLVDLKRDERDKGIFFFEDRDDRPILVRGYFSGELTGSLKAFSNAWADLKSFVNQIEMERRNGKRNQS